MATISIAPAHGASSSATRRLSWIGRWPLLAYFALALVGTWLIVVPMALGGGEYGLGLLPFTVPSGVDFLLVQFSAYTGPLLAAVVVIAVTEGREGLRRLRQRMFQWRVGVRWYLAALFVMLAIWMTSYSLVLEGAPVADLVRQPMLLLTAFLPFVMIGLILPSLGEEPGWRGFALPRLQKRFGPLLGTLILGAIHGVWHLPAFFTAALGPFTVTKSVTFVLIAVAATFIYTWIFNNAAGSVLLAMLLHASSNAASGLMNKLVPEDLPLDGWMLSLVDGGWLEVLAFGVIALLLVAFTGGRLGYRRENTASEATSDRHTERTAMAGNQTLR